MQTPCAPDRRGDQIFTVWNLLYVTILTPANFEVAAVVLENCCNSAISIRYLEVYTGCPRRNGQNYRRVFLMLNHTDITQNTYIQS